MKTRLSLIFAALVVLLFAMTWVIRDRNGDPRTSDVPAMAIAQPISIQPATQPVVWAPADAVNPAPLVAPAQIPPSDAGQAPSRPLVHIDADGTENYMARSGDTVSELAIALLGSDSKSHRDAVIAANASLQANPDRVLYGQTYSIRPTADQASAPSATAGGKEDPIPAIAKTNADNDRPINAEHELKYTAQPGDSVAALAANLLGGDTRENREAIISGNESLQQDPDRLVAGKTYKIVTTGSLAADPQAASRLTQPTTQPDADDAARLSVGRQLQYTAQPGDTVSKLALVLLGSDTKANREAIIKSNQSLKQDPDHLVAGRTYWIAAPTADAAQ